MESFKEAYVGWHGSVGRKEVVLRTIDACSEIFFMGKLKSNNAQFERNRQITDLGSCFLVTAHGGAHVLMKMSPKDHHEMTRDRDQRSGYIGTLLHELCHAFALLYSCGGECQQFQCVAEQSIAHGDTGHAKVWFVLVAFVQMR